MHKRILIFFILIINLFLLGIDSETNTKDLSENISTYSAINLKSDFQQCYDLIKRYHPDPFAYISEESLDKIFYELKNEILDDMNSLEFNKLLTSFISNVGDGHIFIGMSEKELQIILGESQLIPLNIKIISNEMYISDSFNSDLLGCKITSINSLKNNLILESIMKHLNSDGNKKWSKYNLIESNFSLFFMLYIGSFDKYSIEYLNLEGKSQFVVLESINITQIEEYGRTLPNVTPLNYIEYSEDSTAYLKIGSFNYYGPETAIFKEYVDESFQKLFDSNFKNLIIDLRGNGGGDPYASTHLLSYLMNKEYQYFAKIYPGYYTLGKLISPHEETFKGNLYLLIDGGCFSTTGHFLSILKNYKIGTLIGSPSGGTYFCNDNSKDYHLSNTDFRFHLPNFSFFTAVEGFEKGIGIQPDFFIQTKPGDLKTKEDSVLNFVFNIISEPDK